MQAKRGVGATFRWGAQAVILVLAVCSVHSEAFAQPGGHDFKAPREPASQRPRALEGVAIEQKLDAQLPLDLSFVDEQGRTVRLGQYFRGRPVILAPVYYECPMLCTQVLNGLTSALKSSGFSYEVGRDFDVLAVSFNPREGPKLAALKKLAYVDRYGRPDSAGGWHFLTGEQAAITALTDAVGFSYKWDEQAEQYSHLATTIVLTPTGRVSRYFYGIQPAPRDVRLGLVEASQHLIGTLADQVLLYCFHYDPTTGRYGWVAINLLRAGGVLLLVTGVLFWGVMWRRERRGVYARIER
ncbi:MAG: SCO family protein [Luteitalea sp.]|nr:SCO family protein [Luteitalea sp.]